MIEKSKFLTWSFGNDRTNSPLAIIVNLELAGLLTPSRANILLLLLVITYLGFQIRNKKLYVKKPMKLEFMGYFNCLLAEDSASFDRTDHTTDTIDSSSRWALRASKQTTKQLYKKKKEKKSRYTINVYFLELVGPIST